VIVAAGPAAVAAARKATPIIPIVMLDVADPVGAGFVASLVRPGGNVTGLANLAQETAGKRLELLKAANRLLRVLLFYSTQATPATCSSYTPQRMLPKP